jgi:hypothetical protein
MAATTTQFWNRPIVELEATEGIHRERRPGVGDLSIYKLIGIIVVSSAAYDLGSVLDLITISGSCRTNRIMILKI